MRLNDSVPFRTHPPTLPFPPSPSPSSSLSRRASYSSSRLPFSPPPSSITMAPVNKNTPKTGVNGTKKKRGGEQGEFTLKRVKGSSACSLSVYSSTSGRFFLAESQLNSNILELCTIALCRRQERTSTSTLPVLARRSFSTEARPFGIETERLPRLLPSRRARRMLLTVVSGLTSGGLVCILASWSVILTVIQERVSCID